ncbi:MAG: hypothetical protein ACRDTH_14875 [Pseudonocardiaceae bacterium]
MTPPSPLTAEPRPERNAVEVFLLLLALQSAVMALVAAPSSVSVVLGPVGALVWATGLFAGATVTLTGLFWPGRLATGLLLQQLGYAAFAPMSLARGVALLGIDQPSQAVVVLAFAAAATARLIQLEHRLGRRWWLPCRMRRGRDVES